MSEKQKREHLADNALFASLSKNPQVAWPTIVVFLVAIGLFIASSVGFFMGLNSLPVAVGINSLALYLLFTPTHDAAHKAVSRIEPLNTWIGRVAVFFWAPLAPFSVYRWLHLQHHRFTNEKGDPDLFAGTGKWSLPLRWMLMDLYQIIFFIRHSGRLKKSLPALAMTWSLTLAIVYIAYVYGVVYQLLMLWFLPTRITLVWLTFMLDFLPHYPHFVAQSENPYAATSIRQGKEWLMTPVFLFHNYHLAHHLYPTLPFYRLSKLWYARETYHLSRRPVLVSAFGLRAKAYE